MDTWILTTVRSRYLRRAIVWGLLVVGCLGLAFSQRRYIDNFINGPYDLGAAELSAIRDVTETPRYFVKVTGSKSFDTSLQQITVQKTRGVETSRSVSAAYSILAVGDRFLIVKSSDPHPTTVEGELQPIPFEVSSHLFLTPEILRERDRFLPFYLDEQTAFPFPGYVSIVFALVLIFLLAKFALKDARRLVNPSGHPAVQRAAAWGDPAATALVAEREYREPRFKTGGWRIGDTYLVRSTFFSFDILRVEDLLWGYKALTQHRTNGIPTRKTYAAVLACYGGTATIAGSEQTAEEIIAFAGQRAPWAMLGYSNELADFFKNNTNDFCQTVEQRRQAYQG